MNNVSRETNVVFVVEGKNDASTLKGYYPDINVVITNGSAVSNEFLLELSSLSKHNRIILLLDPDGPGEKIRKKITEYLPNVEHIFVDRKSAISSNKKKVGIEHMTKEDLDAAIKDIRIVKNDVYITRNQLYDLDLLGKPDSRVLRDYLCNALKIGKANAKTLLNKLNMFGITLEELNEVVRGYYDRKL